MAEEKKQKDGKASEIEQEAIQSPWMSDSYVLQAAKFRMEDVIIELKANYGFRDDTDENALKLSRAARAVMEAHRKQSGIL